MRAIISGRRVSGDVRRGVSIQVQYLALAEAADEVVPWLCCISE